MWRDQNITHELLVLTEEKQDQVQMADQSILNIYFETRWLHLDYKFNQLTGLDFLHMSGKIENLNKKLKQVANILTSCLFFYFCRQKDKNQ